MPLIKSIYHIKTPRYREEIKPILSYLEVRKNDKDIVYVYSEARPALKYYKRYFKLNNIEFIYGKHSGGKYKAYLMDINELKGQQRVWFSFSMILN